MVNYIKSKIYKVYCDISKKTYYGSTTLTLNQRLQCHKSSDRIVSREMKDPKIFLVEDYPCNTKKELLTKEKEYIMNNECINKSIPLRSKSEWRQSPEAKQKAKEYNKFYSEKFREQHKQKITCECGSTFRNRDISKHKKTKKHLKFVSSKKV